MMKKKNYFQKMYFKPALALASQLALSSMAFGQIISIPGNPSSNSPIGSSVTPNLECVNWVHGGAPYGLVQVFKNGAYYDSSTSTECIYNLGIYDAEGNQIASNFSSFVNSNVLTGKYLDTNSLWLQPPQGAHRFSSNSNDFRADYTGGSGPYDLETSLLYSSEAHMYYYIDKYRRTLLNDSFIDSLNLPTNLANNIKYLQYRPDYASGQQTKKPLFSAFQTEVWDGIILYFQNNLAQVATRSREGVYASYPPLSIAFDNEAIVGDYAGLAAIWILGTNQSFPGAAFYGQDNSWINNVLSPLNDGLSNFEAYAFSGKKEQLKYISWADRTWAGTQCGSNGWAACDRGYKIQNVMMYDETDMTRTGVFPLTSSIPSNPPGGSYGFVGSNLASLYFSSLFYDISVDAGLGLYKTRQLVWKMLSLIDNTQAFTMRDFGSKMILAARALWPKGLNDGVYEADIADVLRSRGIALYGEASFKDGLPAALSPTLQGGAINYFGSAHPDSQPTAYNSAFFTINSYREPGNDYNYVAYNFYKHSKYGPCDKLVITNGTFTNGNYNNDGDYYWEGKDREMGNLTLFVPEAPNRDATHRVMRWERYKLRCSNETGDGFYAEDVKPFGFRVISAIKNGYSFTATKISDRAHMNTITYRLNIVDPSVSFAGPATYTWTFTDYLGVSTVLSGTQVNYAAFRDQPFTVTITRQRGQQIDTLTKRERGNDLDRNGGTALVKNLCPNNSSCMIP